MHANNRNHSIARIQRLWEVLVELFMPLFLQIVSKQAGVWLAVKLLALLLWHNVSATAHAVGMRCRSAWSIQRQTNLIDCLSWLQCPLMFEHLGAVRLCSNSVDMLSMDESVHACKQEKSQLRTEE